MTSGCSRCRPLRRLGPRRATGSIQSSFLVATWQRPPVLDTANDELVNGNRDADREKIDQENQPQRALSPYLHASGTDDPYGDTRGTDEPRNEEEHHGSAEYAFADSLPHNRDRMPLIGEDVRFRADRSAADASGD